MPAAQFIASTHKQGPGVAAFGGAWPLWTALTLVALITMLRSTGSVDSDVAWQLWIAGRIHAGANLYTDIIETNPPLWFWMAVPVERVSALLHIRIEAVLVVAVGCAVALSLAATDRLTGDVPAKRRALLLAFAAIALTVMPWMHVGQREQFVLIGAVPYAALIAARREGKAVEPLLAILVGLGCALGFALKHYFLLVPALLELWLILGRRTAWRPFRQETLALVAAGLAYATAILVFEQDYLFHIVPLVRLAYVGFGTSSIWQLIGPMALCALAIFALLAAYLRPGAGRHTALTSAFTVAAIGFAGAYVIQFKAWPYHAIPMVGAGSLALAALLAEADPAPRLLRVIGPVVLSLPLLLAAGEARMAPNGDVEQAVSGLASDDAVGFLTTENAAPWPITLQRHYRYASRYDGFWMMDAIVRNQRRGNPDARLSALGREIVANTAADFICVAPKRIIVSRPRRGEDAFDILPFFTRDPRFAELMSHYRIRSRTTFETYELVSPLPRPNFTCRNGI